MKAVILARISSDKQDKEYSKQAQVSHLSEYANRKSLPLIREPFVIIESSTVGDRKKFMECIDFCVANGCAVIIDTIDRAQRSFTEIPLLERLRREGKLEMHFVRENLVINKDTSGTDIIMWHQGVLMAEAYSLHFKENVARSVAGKIAKGEYPGRAPIGYMNVRTLDNRSDIVPDPERAPLVRMLFEEYAKGSSSLKELVRLADDWGLRVKPDRRSNGEIKLRESYIHALLQSPFYYGLAKWGNYTFEHRYERLIPKTLWDSVQDALHGRSNNNSGKRGVKDFLYRGLIRDHYTGRIISTERKKDKYNYLMPWTADGGHKSVNEDVVSGQIARILATLTIPREAVDEVIGYMKQTKDTELIYHQRAVKEFQRDLATNEKRKAQLLTMRLDNEIDKQMFDAKDTELKNEALELRNKIALHQQSNEKVDDTIVAVFEACSEVEENFLKSSEAASKRAIVKTIFRTLELKDGNLGYSLRFPFSEMQNLGQNETWRAREDSNL